MNLDELMSRAVVLKQEIDLRKTELEIINDELARRAKFEDGKATAYITGQAYKAKIVKRTNDRWDQEKLNYLRQVVGDPIFMKGFKFSWDARGKKAVAAMSADLTAEQQQMLSSAVKSNTKSYVTYEEIGPDA